MKTIIPAHAATGYITRVEGDDVTDYEGVILAYRVDDDPDVPVIAIIRINSDSCGNGAETVETSEFNIEPALPKTEWDD